LLGVQMILDSVEHRPDRKSLFIMLHRLLISTSITSLKLKISLLEATTQVSLMILVDFLCVAKTTKDSSE
jgi:hypothetical protein